MTRRRKIIIGSIVALVILVLLPMRAHYRAKGALAAYKLQLQAQGEKLSIEELIPSPSTNGPNGAIPFGVAASRITWYDPRQTPATMKELSPGHAITAWQQELMEVENAITNPWPRLRLEVETNRGNMEPVRIALLNPVFDFNLNYRKGFSIGMTHLSSIRWPSQWFAAATLLELHDGHAEVAWENLRTTMASTRFLADEPLMISQMARETVLMRAFAVSWDTLQFPGWKDEQLAELQAAWQATQRPNSLNDCLAMERAMVVDLYDQFRRTPSQMKLFVSSTGSGPGSRSFLLNPKAGFQDWIADIRDQWIWPLWTSYEDELWSLHAHQVILTGARSAAKNHALVPALKSINQNLAKLGPAEQQFLVATNLDPGIFTHVLSRFAQTEAMRELVVTAIALKRHQLRHGKYPAELSALVPEFLSTIPLDFMDGKPLRYRPLPDGQFLLYSIGEDGEDNGGDPSPPNDKWNRNFWTGRDLVWPQSASPAEIEAHNAALRERQHK